MCSASNKELSRPDGVRPQPVFSEGDPVKLVVEVPLNAMTLPKNTRGVILSSFIDPFGVTAYEVRFEGQGLKATIFDYELG